MIRRKTFEVKIGAVTVGGDNPIAVQSMLCAPIDDIEANVRQTRKLYDAGCDIVRVAVTKQEDMRLIEAIKSASPMPLVADIQFDYRLAVAAAEHGVDKVRINPGNIGSEERIAAVTDACRKAGIPIRIGVNSGSISKEIRAKYGRATPDAMVESAMYNIKCLEKQDFHNYLVALKCSGVADTIESYRKMAEQTDCPLHLGVTESGGERMGLIKSSAALGSLLCDGIGDTIRISLTADPVREVLAAKDLLKALDMHTSGVQIVSCPTCGRCTIDMFALADQVEKALSGCRKRLKVAVMGCIVNGPGEAEDADIGITGADGQTVFFRGGRVISRVPQDSAVSELIRLIDQI